LRRVADLQLEIDLGIALMKRDEMSGEPIACRRLAGEYRQGSPTDAAEISKRILRPADQRDDRLRILEKFTTFRRQLNSAPYPIEEVYRVALLERMYGAAHCRLCHVQRFRGARDMLSLRDGEEDAELFQGQIREPFMGRLCCQLDH
jgi:hypothetical protein